MATRAELITLMSRADTAWTTVQGVSRHWRDQRLVTIAFHRRTAALSAAGQPPIATLTARSNNEGDVDPIIETVLTVAADHRGRRRRADLVSRRNEPLQPDTLIINGDTFWARTGSSTTTNAGNPRSSHGGAGIIDLLLPSAVPAGFDLAPTGELDEVAGRACAVASAAPRENDLWGRTPGSEVFNMIAGGTDFHLSIDLLTGALLQVIKFVDGAVAEICEFTTISFDEPLNDTLFAPPGPMGE
jgi:hypothetical protein